MSKKSSNTYSVKDGRLVSGDLQEVIIADEAIDYIVSRYIQGKNVEGAAPVVIGIPTHVVEDVLRLFVDWAALNGYVKDNILIIGGHKVG